MCVFIVTWPFPAFTVTWIKRLWITEIIALDTEYHDPEEIQSLTQWPNSGQDLRPVKSDSLLSDTTPDHAFTRKSTVMIHTDDEANTKSTVVLSYPKVFKSVLILLQFFY